MKLFGPIPRFLFVAGAAADRFNRKRLDAALACQRLGDAGESAWILGRIEATAGQTEVIFANGAAA
jgi:hypothetical protein